MDYGFGGGGGGVDKYSNSINFRHGLIFVNFGHTKNTEISGNVRN